MFNAKSVDPYQTPHSAASDLGLHCFQIALFVVSRLKWVNTMVIFVIFVSDNKQWTLCKGIGYT